LLLKYLFEALSQCLPLKKPHFEEIDIASKVKTPQVKAMKRFDNAQPPRELATLTGIRLTAPTCHFFAAATHSPSLYYSRPLITNTNTNMDLLLEIISKLGQDYGVSIYLMLG